VLNQVLKQIRRHIEERVSNAGGFLLCYFLWQYFDVLDLMVRPGPGDLDMVVSILF